MVIIFRDRPLKPNEKSHYYCDECRQELHRDLAYSHKCKINNDNKSYLERCYLNAYWRK